MAGNDDKPKIAVLEDEAPREQPDLDPPESGAKQLARGAKLVMVFGGLFLLVMVCAAPPTLWMLWPSNDSGGAMVVLPFVQQGESNAIAKTVTSELIRDLSANAQLEVKPLAVSKKLAEDSRDALAIGKDLGVRYVVQGEITRRGEDKLMVTVAVVHVEKGGSVLNEHFRGTTAGTAKLEDEIAEAVIAATTKP